jgi:hypothetical protein
MDGNIVGQATASGLDYLLCDDGFPYAMHIPCEQPGGIGFSYAGIDTRNKYNGHPGPLKNYSIMVTSKNCFFH